MSSQVLVEIDVSDQALIQRARDGDRTAFAELWVRHASAGMTAARCMSTRLDADDLVAEAFTRIYQLVLQGGGPTGAFRPYLYTTIRNLARRWGSRSRDVQLDDMGDVEDDRIPDDLSTLALDEQLTASAFQSLPERWQSVLWYTEVEGMTPQQAAPHLGLSANGVSALAYRAREGLRTAWLQAHVSRSASGPECRWVMSRVGENARHSLTKREKKRMDEHLRGCDSCHSVSTEVDEVGSSLAVVMLPLLVGATAGGSLLATFGGAGSATAATLAASNAAGMAPAIPSAFLPAGGLATSGAAGASAAAVASAAGVSAVGAATGLSGGASVVVASLVAAAVLGTGVVIALPPVENSAPVAIVQSIAPTDADAAGGSADANAATGKDASADGTPDSAVKGVVDGVTDVVKGVLPVGPVPEHSAPDGVAGALIDLDLNGKGMPGATVSAQVAGQVYTTVVAKNGTWALRITALPEGVGPLRLSQRLTVLGIPVPIDVPLTLLSDALGVTVELLN